MNTRVFVSSTCFDLIDLRAEVSSLLSDMDLIPVLSDGDQENFEINPTDNSIEQCLANLRSSGTVIIILSQRYGPSLKTAGFDDVSATHLEIREAINLKLPILIYVRDRLEGEHETWCKNGRDMSMKFSWTQKNTRIFQVLDEVKKLQNSERNNFYCIFSDSVDLKKQIRSNLKDKSNRGLLRRLITEGRAPVPSVKIFDLFVALEIPRIAVILTITNHGHAPMLGPQVSLKAFEQTHILNIDDIKNSTSAQIRHNDWMANSHPNRAIAHDAELTITYSTIDGFYIQDVFSVKLESKEKNQSSSWSAVTLLNSRRLLPGHSFVIE